MMSYTHEELISDLNNDVEWNNIRKRAVASKLKLSDVPEDDKLLVKQSMDKYFKRKYMTKELDPNVHYDIPYFCKNGR